MFLQVAPDVFDRVELRGVAGEKLDLDEGMLAGQELPDQPTFVDVGRVPDDQQPAANVAKQMGQEDDHFSTADRAGEETEVEVPKRYPGNRREVVPVEVVLEDRRLSFGRPCPDSVGPFREAALVDEDNGSPFFFGVFFRVAHRCFFHHRIASSSLSKAFPTGRCGVNPSCRRSRQTWPGWNFTPNSSWMTLPTRQLVQSPVVNPSLSGPAFTMAFSRESSPRVS